MWEENFVDFQLIEDFKVNYVSFMFTDNPTDYKDYCNTPVNRLAVH
jgi:hypothetical protein